MAISIAGAIPDISVSGKLGGEGVRLVILLYRIIAMPSTELLTDVIGINSAGVVCHPFKGKREGPKKDLFSYTFKTDSNVGYEAATESEIKRMIEAGEFNEKGRIRMIPAGTQATGNASALSVKRYLGKSLPI